MLFSSIAYAQEAAQRTPSMMEQLLPFGFIFIIFYFLLIRPQQNRHKKQQAFLTELKKGDSVLTAGGMLGTIRGITGKFVTLEISDNVNVRILKSQVASSFKEDTK